MNLRGVRFVRPSVVLFGLQLSIALAIVTFVNAQPISFPPLPIASSGSSRQAAEALIFPNFICHMTATPTILGYLPKTRTPVYQNRCSGVCLSLASQKSTCSPKYQSRLLSPVPLSRTNALVKVQQVIGCSCSPSPCVVTDADGVTTTYQSGQTAYDACDRKCTCSYGNLINCCRQRKEWRLGMTDAERLRYLNAYKTVSTTLPYKTAFDALINKHQIYFHSGIHFVPMFFPWHRAYVWELESLLRQVDCRVTQPYWRWSLEAAAPFSSSIWSNTDGFGGNGDPSTHCVTGGPFSPPWVPPAGGCIARSFTLTSQTTFATVAHINDVLNVNCPNPSDYTCMQQSIEHFHGQVHNAIGGQFGHMTYTNSSNDPIFFQHHGHIDYIWAQWQAKGAAWTSAYPGAVSTPLPGDTSYVVSDWLDLNKQAGQDSNKVCYIDTPNTFWLNPLFANLNVTEQAHVPRLALQPFFETWLAQMNMHRDQVAPVLRWWQDINDPNLHPIIPESQRFDAGLLGVYLYDEYFKPFGPLEAEGCVHSSSEPAESVTVELSPTQLDLLNANSQCDTTSDPAAVALPQNGVAERVT